MTWKNEFNLKANTYLIATVEVIASIMVFILDQFQSTLHNWFQVLLPLVGVEINGPNPWDIQVKNKRFYALFIAKCTTGSAEAFCNGYFDCEDMIGLLSRFSQSSFVNFCTYYHPYEVSKRIIHRWFDVLTKENTCNAIAKHYDQQNEATYKDLWTNSAQYSVGLFPKTETPEFRTIAEVDQYYNDAVYRMREEIAKKLKLKPGMRVLDIGCGFGALAKHLAEKYDVHVTGVTISQDMAAEARKVCKGLNVNIECMDYRCIKGKFDRITCVEMFCHVGEHHHREYFEHVHDWLKDDGILLLQTISVNHRFTPSYLSFFESHLKFYAHMSRPEEIIKHSTGLFILEDWRNYGYHSFLTCEVMLQKFKMMWQKNVEKFDDASNRKLLMYVALAGAGTFTRKIQLLSAVFTKDGMKCIYDY